MGLQAILGWNAWKGLLEEWCLRGSWVLTGRKLKLCLVQCSGNRLTDPRGDSASATISRSPGSSKLLLYLVEKGTIAFKEVGHQIFLAFHPSKKRSFPGPTCSKPFLSLWSPPQIPLLSLYGMDHGTKNYPPQPLPQIQQATPECCTTSHHQLLHARGAVMG